MTSAFWWSYVLLWCVVVVLAVTQLAVLHYFAVVVARLEPFMRSTTAAGIAIGDPLPEIQFPNGAPKLPISGENSWILVVSESCSACTVLLSELRDWHRSGTIVMQGVHDAGPVRRRFHLPPDLSVLADPLGATRATWGINKVPTALAVAPNGRVSGIIPGVTATQLGQLAAQRSEHGRGKTEGEDRLQRAGV